MSKIVKEKLINYISMIMDIDVEEIDEEMDLIKDLGMDSLEVVEMICYLEKEFKAKIKFNNAGDQVYTIKYVVDSIVSLL